MCVCYLNFCFRHLYSSSFSSSSSSSFQTKLTSLYQTACEESERKVEELAKGLERLQAVVEEVEGERDSYRESVGELEAR